MSLFFNSADSYKTYPSAQGTVDSTGTCEIDFSPAPAGNMLTGGITVYDSPTTAQWTVYINDVAIDVTTGPATMSGIQVGPSDIIKVIATGLLQNVGSTFHATFNAIVSPETNTPLIVPGHDAYYTPPRVGDLYNLGTIGGGNQSYLAPFSSPVLDIHNVAAIGMYWSTGDQAQAPAPVVITMNWLADDQKTVIFSEQWSMDAPGALAHAGLQLLDIFATLTNYIQFSFGFIQGGNKLTIAGRVWAAPPGSNIVPMSPKVLIIWNTLVVPASGSVTVGWLTPQIPGDVEAWTYFSQTGAAEINTYGTDGAYDHDLFQWPLPSYPMAGSQQSNAQFTLTRDSTQIVVANSAAAQGTTFGSIVSRR